MDVTILLGSKSDMPIAEKCTKILEQFDVPYQLRVASAHRSPKFVESIVADAEESGCTVFIAMAGLAAAVTIPLTFRLCPITFSHSVPIVFTLTSLGTTIIFFSLLPV